MADKTAGKSTKKRTLAARKKPELTVRQRSEQKQVAKRKLVRATAKTASRPVRAIGRFIAMIARPFSFLLWPFKTRPARFVGRALAAIFFLRYFRNAWKELKQVSWPNRKETWQLTFAVFVFAIIFAIFITIIDFGLDKLFRNVILK